MAKIRRHEAVTAALELLNEVGLDALTTRRLAQKLGVESATLYWHFRDKAALLGEMAREALDQSVEPIPSNPVVWETWFAENARSFRRALLSYRDGARLHAGLPPNLEDAAHLALQAAYLTSIGFSEQQAFMALFTMSQFAVGCVLEQQAREGAPTTALAVQDAALKALPSPVQEKAVETIRTTLSEGDAAFEFGLNLILAGLRNGLSSTE